MVFACERCGKTFPKNQNLLTHLARKRQCVEQKGDNIACDRCNKTFTRSDSLARHKRKYCQARLANQELAPANTPLANTPLAIAQVEKMIEDRIALQQPAASVQIGNNTNTVNQVNQINITPWGTPLNITDAVVEAALLQIPGMVGAPELAKVSTLMTIVKSAHKPIESRNVYLNPKRADLALAHTGDGWATLPLSEATAALFDGASARIAERALTAALPAKVVEQRIRSLQAEVPAQYRRDKENAVLG